MDDHILVRRFARNYGVYEGLLLSEMCRAASYSGGRERAFTISDLSGYFDYLSERQIRYAARKLEVRGCLVPASRGVKGFERTAYWRVSADAYRAYGGR